MAKTKKSLGGSVIETIKTIVYALILAGIFRSLFFQPFWIPSGSMKPNLLIGDFLFVNKFAYGYSRYSCPYALCPIYGRIFYDEPNRGDIVVFRNPRDGRDFIKRLIGIPGDKIEIKSGKLIVNGKNITQDRVQPFIEKKKMQGPLGSIPRCTNSPVALGADCIKEQFVEKLDLGKSYSILNIGYGSGDELAEFLVPEGHFFFMGDNRDNSQDSRFSPNRGGIGLVHQDFLIGRADRVLFSSSGSSMLAFWTWRSDRFLKGLN